MATQHCSRSGTVYPHFSSRPTAALAAVLDNLSDAPLLARPLASTASTDALAGRYARSGGPTWPASSSTSAAPTT